MPAVAPPYERVEPKALLVLERVTGKWQRITNVQSTAMPSLWWGEFDGQPVFVDTFAMCVLNRDEKGAAMDGPTESYRLFYFKEWKRVT